MVCRHVIEGNRLRLRGIRLEDVNDNYHRWMNDTDVTRFLECRFCSYSIEDIKKFVSSIQNDQDSLLFALVLKQTRRHIGNIKLGPIDRNHRIADIGLLIGEKDCWGKGYATEAIQLIADFAFGELGLRKLTAGAYAKNTGSISAFKKAGFAVEGIFPQHYILDDTYQDRVCLGLVKNSVAVSTFTPIYIEYKNFYLRELQENDVSEKYANWLADETVTEFLEVKYSQYTVDDLKKYVRSLQSETSCILFGIFSQQTHEHIGNASINSINYNTGTFAIGYFVGEKSYWGKSAGVEVMIMLLNYAFEHLKLRRFYDGAYENNLSARFVNAKVGLVEVAILEGKYLYKGTPVAEIVYSMERLDWMEKRTKFFGNNASEGIIDEGCD